MRGLVSMIWPPLVYERAVLAVPAERMTEITELTKRNMAIVKSDNARHGAAATVLGILQVVRIIGRLIGF